MNVPLYGDSLRRNNAILQVLKVQAQDDPSMSVKVNPGTPLVGTGLIEYVGGNSPTFTAASAGKSKWVLVSLTHLGVIALTNGVEATSSPVPPAIPNKYIPLALVYIQDTTVKITPDMIFDIRGVWSQSTPAHNDLDSRDAAGAHPIGAITGLQTALDAKAESSTLTDQLAAKADTDGTVDDKFTLNKDLVGAPSSDGVLEVERGSSANVGIRFNETDDKWQFTNDGETWYDFGIAGSSTKATNLVHGILKLSVAAADAAQPIAVGDNDSRITAVANKANKVGTDDIEITDNTKGVILRSPNNTRYRLTVDDAGALTTELVT